MNRTKSVLSRIGWALFRRHWLQFRLTGFWASIRSNVSPDSTLSDFTKIYKDALILSATLGRFSYVSAGAHLVNCRVGAFCSIGPEVLIGGLGKHPTRWVSSHPSFYSMLNQAGRSFVKQNYYEELREVVIENDVWIGARAIVLDGVRIGNGAIVGAGAVVIGDVEPYAVVVGVPGRTVRRRFGDGEIEILEKLKWWDWPLDKLETMAPAFRSEDPRALLR